MDPSSSIADPASSEPSVRTRQRLTSEAIRAQARSLGFDACGIAPAGAFPELQYLREWIDRGYAGRMGFLTRSANRRGDVRRVMPSVRSVIAVAMVYNVERPYSTEAIDPGEAIIARYAWGRDYHDVIGERLASLVAFMRERSPEPFDARAWVDTGPVQERVYAQYAGIGWIGKNTCVINPELGSWLLLGEILTSLALEPDAPATDQCGTCTLCLDACPTGAFVEPWRLDATRCISYLTIELRGSIPEPQRDSVGSHVFGCDICQEVCPWNHRPARASSSDWMPRDGLDRPQLLGLWRRSDDELEDLVAGSAMNRAGVAGLRRNLAVAMGNAGLDPAAADSVPRIGRASVDDPIVAEHVRWAASKGTS